MIKWLIKPGEEQNLAWLAIVLPLASMSFWIPGVAIFAPLQFVLKKGACELVLLAFIVLWFFFVVALWWRALKMIRKARIKEVSPKIFHWLQIFGLTFFGTNLFVKGGDWVLFFQWAVCMDVAMAVFYFSFFLLALLTWTKIPWPSVTGFGIVLLTLIFEMHHNPFHGHGF